MNAHASETRRARILCIDDAEVALHVRKLIFQHAGYDVATAHSREEALEIFRNEPIDIVIADHFLSDTTGTETAREMKQMRPEIPILLVSAVSEKPAGMEFVDGFLPKGESPQALLSTIAELLHSQQNGRANISKNQSH